jgi:hypothetical protein
MMQGQADAPRDRPVERFRIRPMPAGMLAERDKVVEGLGEAEGPFVATEERGRTCQVRHLDGILLTADCNPLFTSCTTPLTALSKWRLMCRWFGTVNDVNERAFRVLVAAVIWGCYRREGPDRPAWG